MSSFFNSLAFWPRPLHHGKNLPTQGVSTAIPRPEGPFGLVQGQRLPILDGVRGLAISMVVVGHIIHPHNQAVGNFIGISGVSFFLVLSGYLISRVLLTDELRVGRVRLVRFYIRRALRIVPAFVVFLIVLAILVNAGIAEKPTPITWLASCFYFRNIAGTGWDTGHLWSLSLEEQFYLIWPIMLVLITGRQVRLRTIVIIVALCTLWRVFSGASLAATLERIDLRGDTFLIGASSALGWTSPTLRQIPMKWIAAVLLPWSVFSPVFSATRPIQCALQALMIMSILQWLLDNPESLVSRGLSHPVLRTVGTVSYSLYLWQQLLLGPHFRWWSLPVLAVVTCVSYICVEKPFLKLQTLVL